MPADKAQIRRDTRQRLRDWGESGGMAASLVIQQKLAELVPPAAKVLCFYPCGISEPMIEELVVDWPRLGQVVCLPLVDGVQMSAHRFTQIDALIKSKLGIFEPDPSRCPEVALDEIDVVLVPGVAFTRDGARLGRGGGHYDRFLTRLPSSTRKIGVAYRMQLWAELPVEAHDVRVDEVITE